MARMLDTNTLDIAAQHYAAEFISPDKPHPTIEGSFLGGPAYVMENFFNFTYMDEFEYMLAKIRGQLGQDTLPVWDAAAAERFTPRSETMFEELLSRKLAVDLDGNHIDGKIGTVNVGARVVGKRLDRNGIVVRNEYWKIYAGEGNERASGSGVADELPEGAEPLPIGALNTRIANIIALKMCDAAVDELDAGTAAGVIEGRTGAQPAGVDVAVTGTLLFSLPLTDPAFGAAVDAAPGGIATAAAITDDSSADATGTLGYCRASSSNANPTPLDDIIDGEAGVSGADFNFNTVAIVAGAAISMTSWTVTQPES